MRESSIKWIHCFIAQLDCRKAGFYNVVLHNHFAFIPINSSHKKSFPKREAYEL